LSVGLERGRGCCRLRRRNRLVRQQRTSNLSKSNSEGASHAIEENDNETLPAMITLHQQSQSQRRSTQKSQKRSAGSKHRKEKPRIANHFVHTTQPGSTHHNRVFNVVISNQAEGGLTIANHQAGSELLEANKNSILSSQLVGVAKSNHNLSHGS